MPVLRQPITGLTSHVFFPVIRQVGKRILEMLSFADEVDDRIYINTEWSTHSDTSGKDHAARLGHQSLKIDANIQMNPSSQKWDVYTFRHTASYGLGASQFKDMPLIYCDVEDQVRIHELYTPITIVLNCELFLQSIELAYQTPQQIFNGFNNGDVVIYQDLVYDYPIPKKIVYVLSHLWKLDRKYGAPAKVPFFDYVQRYTAGRWHRVKNRDRNDAWTIVQPVHDLKCLVSLEYSDDKPNADVDNKLPIAFTIPFVCTVQFDMVSHNVIRYPVMYDNQLLPEACIPLPRNMAHNRLREDGESRPLQNYNLRQIDPGIYRVPFYDDWSIPMGATFAKYELMPVAILDIQLDEDSEYTTVDLNQDLGDTNVKAIVKDFWKQAGQDVFRNDVVYGLRLFKDDRELTIRDATFTEDLILKFKPYDRRARYRLVLLSTGDITKVNWARWGDWIVANFKYLNDSLKNKIREQFETGDIWIDDNGTMHCRRPRYPGDDGVLGTFTGRNINVNREYFGVCNVNIIAKRSAT